MGLNGFKSFNPEVRAPSLNLIEMETFSNDDREFDIVLEAKDGTRILARMDVLSRSSAVFKSMFELCETGRENPEELTVDILSGFYLTQLVQYCNTQNVTVANMEILIGMVDYFQLNDAVTDSCLELMAKNLCVENTVNFIIASEKRGRNDLILESMEFIDMFFDSMRAHDKFNEISVGTLQNILKRDTLEVSNEEFVFDVIIKWYAQDKRNRKLYLPDLLKLVRLSDVDRQFIATIFLDFAAAHECAEVLVAATTFLSQDDNSIHKKLNRRLADKIVAFNDHTIQVFGEKTKKWTQLKYVCDKSKAVAYEDRWMKEIEYFFPVFEHGYLSGVKKMQLATRQTILEITLDRKSVVSRAMSKIKVAAWTEGDKSNVFVAGCDERLFENSNDSYPKELRCFRYDENQWKKLPNIYQHGKFVHLVYVVGRPYLYAIGATPNWHESANGIQICRCDITNPFWDTCISMKRGSSLQDLSIKFFTDVSIVNGYFYLVGPNKSDKFIVQCFDPETYSLQTVATIPEPCRSVKLCGTNRFLYVVTVAAEPSQCQKRFFRFDPKENSGRKLKELDSLNSIADGDFQLLNVSNFG